MLSAPAAQLSGVEVALAPQKQPNEHCPHQQAVVSPLQVLTLLRAAGAEQEGASWDQGELAETLWAEMGLQPDAHITHVCTTIRKPCCHAHVATLAGFGASNAGGSLLVMSGRQG